MNKGIQAKKDSGSALSSVTQEGLLLTRSEALLETSRCIKLMLLVLKQAASLCLFLILCMG